MPSYVEQILTTDGVTYDIRCVPKNDANLVHKTGNETIAGVKTFTDNVVMDSHLQMNVSQGEGVYIEAGEDQNGTRELDFFATEDDSAVRLGNIAVPVIGNDAANKEYVDNEAANAYVSLNGWTNASTQETYAIQPYSLCAYSTCVYPQSHTIMTSLTLEGGIGSKTPYRHHWFPIGCKIYYHDGSSAFTGCFTSKRFYTSYNAIDARYSAITGGNIDFSGNYGTLVNSVYLRVEINANNDSWIPFYKEGATNEIIVSGAQLEIGGFYIYLGRRVGNTVYMFQLEDNNPLYACIMTNAGTHLVDWATYVSGNAASYTAGDGIAINNNVISHQGWSHYNGLTQNMTIDSSGVSISYAGNINIPPGVYVLCGHALFSNPNTRENQAHVVLRYRLANSGNYTEVAAASVTLTIARSSTYGGTYGATPLFVQGIVRIPSQPSYFEMEMFVEVETDGNASELVASAPISGSKADAVDPSSSSDPSASYIMIYRIGNV